MSRLLSLRKGALLIAAVAMAVAGCSGSGPTKAPATPSVSPNVLISQSVAKLSSIKTLHAKIVVSGEAKGDLVKSMNLPSGGSMKLDGTTVDMDVDITNQSSPTMHLTLSAPSILGLTADLIVVDGYTYIKTSMTGDKYQKQAYSSASSSAPVTPEELKTQIADFQKQLDQLGQGTYAGVDKVDGKDAYHVKINVPKDALAKAGAEASMSVDSASVDVWVYVADSRPAKIEFKAASSDAGNVDLTVTLTNYDKPIPAVKAPPASQVAPATGN